MPWKTKMVKAGGGGRKRNIEDQAWRVGADNAFESDIFGTITEIAIQMFRRKSKGHKLGALDMKFLSDILETQEGKESFAGAVAKAAAPNETHDPEEGDTADSIEQRIAETMHQASKTGICCQTSRRQAQRGGGESRSRKVGKYRKGAQVQRGRKSQKGLC